MEAGMNASAANATPAQRESGGGEEEGAIAGEERLDQLVEWLWAGLVQDDQGWRLGGDLVRARAWGQVHCPKPDKASFKQALAAAVERGRGR